MRLTWLGQAGFRIELDDVCVVVDPWTSPHELRRVPTPHETVVADGVDWLLVTHEHIDHLDPPAVRLVVERSPDARIVLPASIAPLVAELAPADRVVPVEPGDVLDLGSVECRVVPAFHGVTMDDAYGDGSALGAGPRFVGFVLGGRVYHAGDSIVTDALREALEPLAFDVALLPINGRDAVREARGIVGNMDAAEAVELAVEVGTSTLVPYHWDGFQGNTVSPGAAVDLADGRLHVVVPGRFRPIEIPAPGG